MRKLLALIALMALTAPACARGASASEIIRTAPDKAAEFGSAKVASTVEMNQTLPGPAGDMRLTVIAESEGVFDFASQQGRLTTITRFESPGAPGGSQTLEMVIDGLTFYQSFDCPTGALGAPWLRFDLQTLTGLDPSQVPTSTDPTATLEILKGAADDVEEVGSEEVRGVPTTHYRATISLERALENLDEEARERVRAYFQGAAETLTTDVWLDDEGLLRRMTMEFDASAEGSISTISMTMELFDYGEPVEIEIPPDDRVRPVGSLQELASLLRACSPGPRPPAP